MAEAQNDDASVLPEQTEPGADWATGHSNAFERALPTLAKNDVVMSSRVTFTIPPPRVRAWWRHGT